MVITLIGYRGSGKSTVAAALARTLNWSWIDADVELERRAGRTIRDIFDAEGEAGFRRRESALLAELLAGEKLVLAAGGGAVLDPDTRQRMQRAGPVVWLDAPVETLRRRILQDATTASRRPALTASGTTGEIEQVLARRRPLYQQTATLRIDTDQKDVGHIVDEIVAALKPLLPDEGSPADRQPPAPHGDGTAADEPAAGGTAAEEDAP